MLRKLKNSFEIAQFQKPISGISLKSRNFHSDPSQTNLSSLRNSMQQIHAQILFNSELPDTHPANLRATSYFRSVDPELALRMFDQMPQRDSISWTQIITFYSRSKQSEKAIWAFYSMIQEGQNPNRSSLISTLNSCGNLSKLIQGKQLHSQILKRIPSSDVILGNVLIDFYSKCGELSDAHRAFDEIIEKDLVSWTSMLSGYSQNGLSREALDFFVLIHSLDMGFSHYTFSVTAKACREFKESRVGEELHSLVIKTGFDSNVFVASSLLDMYSKHRNIACARKIFDLMAEPNVVSWTSIITGYVQIGEGEEALELFRHQIRVNVQPDAFSLSSILAACSDIPTLEFGKQIHANIVKLGFEFQLFAGNSLVGMYSKCGCLSDARRMHESMHIHDVVTWTSMIAGYAQHGHGVEALEIFDQMRESNVRPNSITFVAVLSACSRSGLVDEGIKHFRSMGVDYGIEAGEEHYTCMVDILARAGRVKEAEEFMKEMPFEPSASAWGALLSGCRASGELGLGLKCAEQLFRLEPGSASNHILLANMYAAEGRWEEMGRIRGLMKEKGLKKESGYSWIEVGKEVSVFGVGDGLHPQSDLIYAMLHHLSLEMEEKRY
ncbi:pentatricopeptide repeat-containing protein At2g13600-like [Magnolia sinica]|uniref:pentatricopeptide repeat-containing protein At2g13600-like n=1 Tax=Magnolia sinica TaxID=86752 RepID=UPI002658EA42|nr:pentatricopeptide repeat-containing protein At2g13600-like [Magnolia sinica]